jgi:hypothetical protein
MKQYFRVELQGNESSRNYLIYHCLQQPENQTHDLLMTNFAVKRLKELLV